MREFIDSRSFDTSRIFIHTDKHYGAEVLRRVCKKKWIFQIGASAKYGYQY